MPRLVANWKDGYANVNAERIAERDGMVFAYDEKNDLVGVFDLGIINYIYISGGANENKT